jgi:hypothetical protein
VGGWRESCAKQEEGGDREEAGAHGSHAT